MSDLKTVPGLLENAATGSGVVSFLAGEREEVGVGELWRRPERAAGYTRSLLGTLALIAYS